MMNATNSRVAALQQATAAALAAAARAELKFALAVEATFGGEATGVRAKAAALQVRAAEAAALAREWAIN